MRRASSDIHFLSEQRFECTSCGKCCSSGWNVKVNDQARQVIEQSQIYGTTQKEGFLPLALADDGKASLGRRPNGHCVFLAGDSLCDLHREVGLEKKPVVCQTYPRLLTKTPDGYFVSLSFVCPAVLENQGELLTEDEPSLQRLLQDFDTEVPQNVPIGEQVRITPDLVSTWEEYLALEVRLLDAFDAARPALSLLSMTEQIFQASASRNFGNLLSRGFDRSAHAGPLGQQLLDVFTLHSLAILELEKHPERRGNLMESLAEGNSVISLRHGFSLQLTDVVPEARAEDVALIRFYFRNLVFGKRLTTSSVTDGLLTVAVGMSLLLFYLEVFRRGLGNQEARERAFEIVEGDVITHSSGLDVLLDEFGKALNP